MTFQHQYSLVLIQHEVSNSIVEQRQSDGYINATALCHAANKKWHGYVRIESTGHFLRALEAKTQISVMELIQEVRIAGVPSTWVHPKVGIHLAQWLSPEFAVQVSEWVVDWMSGVANPIAPKSVLPYHLNRYLVNDVRVPFGYFSILQESTLGLVGQLHHVGFDIPKGWVPDISIGRTFCKYLRDYHNIDTDQLPTYTHDYLDGRVVPGVKLYPDELLAIYRAWFRNHWLPDHGIKYFRTKDPNSLRFLDRLPALAAPKTPQPKTLPWRKK